MSAIVQRLNLMGAYKREGMGVLTTASGSCGCTADTSAATPGALLLHVDRLLLSVAVLHVWLLAVV